MNNITENELDQLYKLNNEHSEKVAELGIVSWKKIELKQIEDEIINQALVILDKLNNYMSELSSKYPETNFTEILTKHING